MVRYALAGDMLGGLSRNWWVLVVRGAAAVIFGLLALIWPGESLIALVIVFGAFALVDGIAVGVTAFRAAPGTRTPLVIQSVLAILLGLGALIWPLAFGIAAVFMIAVWAVVTGVAEIVTAVRLRAQISSEWLLIFVGALSVLIGALLFLQPMLGALTIVTVVGIYAIVFGVVMAIAGFRLRGAADGAVSAEDRDTAAEDFDGSGDYTGSTGGSAGATAADADDGGPPVSAFDEGYAGGYTDGYRGDQRETEQYPGVAEDETAAPRGGRHRAPKENPDDPGNL